jgi:LysM repeat protein
MTNPNPFVPKGSLLEQQSARRSRLKLGVFCVIAVSSLGLVAMLIQGCKRDVPTDTTATDTATNNPAITDGTNTASMDASNTAAMIPPPSSNSPVAFVPPPTPPPIADVTPGSSYEVAKGDTLGSIAKAHHVSLKDLQAANPGVDSKHLKIKQKLTIPASSAPASATPVAGLSVAPDATTGDTYTVKSGDSLTKIAKNHGTSVKALKAANSLTTDHIKVGQKLKIPAKALVIVDPAPAAAPAAAPALPPLSMPAPAPAK